MFSPVSGMLSFCEGWRPALYRQLLDIYCNAHTPKYTLLMSSRLLGAVTPTVGGRYAFASACFEVVWVSCMFSPVSGILSFCEGWRPVFHGTPTLTELAPVCFPLFLVFCHSVRVGVPCFRYSVIHVDAALLVVL